jgi:hypothetical protein
MNKVYTIVMLIEDKLCSILSVWLLSMHSREKYLKNFLSIDISLIHRSKQLKLTIKILDMINQSENVSFDFNFCLNA